MAAGESRWQPLSTASSAAAHLRCGRFAEGSEPRPLVRRALTVNLAPLTIAGGRVDIHGLASSLMAWLVWVCGRSRYPGVMAGPHRPVSFRISPSAGRTARAGRRAWRPRCAGPVPASSSGATRARAYAPNSTMPTSLATLPSCRRRAPVRCFPQRPNSLRRGKNGRLYLEICH